MSEQELEELRRRLVRLEALFERWGVGLAQEGALVAVQRRLNFLGAQVTQKQDEQGSYGEIAIHARAPLRIQIALRQPLATGPNRAQVDHEWRAIGQSTARIQQLYARARSTLSTATTFRVSRNGVALSADVTIPSGARESSVVTITAITLADGDELDVEQLAGGSTQDVAVDVFLLGNQDVLATL